MHACLSPERKLRTRNHSIASFLVPRLGSVSQVHLGYLVVDTKVGKGSWDIRVPDGANDSGRLLVGEGRRTPGVGKTGSIT